MWFCLQIQYDLDRKIIEIFDDGVPVGTIQDINLFRPNGSSKIQMLVGNRFVYHESTINNKARIFCFTGSPEAALLGGGEMSQIYLWGRVLTKLERELVYAKQYVRVSSHLLIFWWSEIAKNLPAVTPSNGSSSPVTSGTFNANAFSFPAEKRKK